MTERLRVQRVDSSGSCLWDSLGVRLSLSETNQGDQAIVSDGTGGCIVAWHDTLSMIRIQRLDNFGTRAWGDSGITIDPGTQYVPSLIQVEPDKFVVAFGAQLKKIDAEGNLLWNGQGVNVGFGTRSIIADGQGGLIVYDGAGSSDNVLIVTQRIDSSGAFVWNGSFVILDDSAIFNVSGNPVALNGDGGATFAWTKKINGTIRSFTRRLRSDGTFVSSAGPVQVSSFNSGANGTWAIVPSVGDSKIYINADSRYGNSLYAQRMDSTATKIWDTNDVAVSLRQLGDLKTVSDGNGGAIIVGFDQSDFSIRTQQLSSHGNLGEVITAVEVKEHFFPQGLLLYQNYPNPFNSSTIIRYNIAKRSWVKIEVFNMVGQLERTIVDKMFEPGSYYINMNAEALPSAVYLYRMQTNQGTLSHKFIILK